MPNELTPTYEQISDFIDRTARDGELLRLYQDCLIDQTREQGHLSIALRKKFFDTFPAAPVDTYRQIFFTLADALFKESKGHRLT